MGALRLNVLMDDEFRADALKLIREQIRPIVDDRVNGIAGDLIGNRISEMLDKVPFHEIIGQNATKIVGEIVKGAGGEGEIRRVVADTLREMVHEKFKDELRMLIRPLVKEAMRDALK